MRTLNIRRRKDECEGRVIRLPISKEDAKLFRKAGGSEMRIAGGCLQITLDGEYRKALPPIPWAWNGNPPA